MWKILKSYYKHFIQKLLIWQTQSTLEVAKKTETKTFEQPRETALSHKHTCLQRRGGCYNLIRGLVGTSPYQGGNSHSAPVDFCLVGIRDQGHRIFQASNRRRVSRRFMWNFLIFKISWGPEKKKKIPTIQTGAKINHSMTQLLASFYYCKN